MRASVAVRPFSRKAFRRDQDTAGPALRRGGYRLARAAGRAALDRTAFGRV